MLRHGLQMFYGEFLVRTVVVQKRNVMACSLSVPGACLTDIQEPVDGEICMLEP